MIRIRLEFTWVIKELASLNGFLNLAGPQAARTDTHAFYRAFFDDLDILQVWIELTRTNIVRVRNCMPEKWAFFANITLHRHNHYSRQNVKYYQQPSFESIILFHGSGLAH